MNVKLRQHIERSIVREICLNIINDGLFVGIHNGEEFLGKTRSIEKIMDDIMSVDEEYIYVWGSWLPEEERYRRVGWIFLIYGETGWDVVSDMTINMEPYVDHVIDKYEEMYA